ncbi:MAG: hypothetical protein ACLVHV_17040 [Oscillospiraceae bacterium]|jgi:hypothetical protein|nr:MAG TPA: tail protein [Caudoviricetes sp.]
MSISYTKKIWQNGDLLDAASLNNPESGAGANADAISEIQAALPSYVGSSIARKQAAAYTPGTADQIIGANQYLAGPQTIKGDPDLKAENIKSGVNIFGVDGSYEGSGSGGLDTSDATAAATDIANGKTAYVNGAKVTGTLPSASRVAYAPSGSSSGDAVVSLITTTPTVGSAYKKIRIKSPSLTAPSTKSIVDPSNTEIFVEAAVADFGNATAADVAAGKTFTSTAGLKVTGTHQCASGLDTSDATAAAADIVSGKTAYVNGVKLIGTHTCPSGGGGLTVATGTTTSGTIETGLSSLAYLVLYKDSISATGLVQAVYVASEGTSHMTTCDSYSSYFKSFSASTSTADTTNGGTFNWGGTGTKALNGTYNWIAFGAA